MTTAPIQFQMHGPPSAWPNNATIRFPIPNSDEGIDLTIAAATAMAHDAVEHSAALPIFMRSLAPGSPLPTPRIVYDALRRLVRFKPDPRGIEHLRTPDQLIDQIRRHGFAEGDCDDRATLGAAILLRMGLPAFFAVISRTPHGRFEHVHFGYFGPDGEPVPMDPQEGPEFGVWHRLAVRRRIYPL